MDDVERDDAKLHASRRVAADLRTQIQEGTLKPGDKLPPYRELAGHFGVVTNTAMAGVRILRDEGLVTIRRNVGAIVRDRGGSVDPGAVRMELEALQEQLSQVGGTVARIAKQLGDVAAKLPQNEDGERV